MDRAFEQVIETEEPSKQASYEAEINAVEIGEGVRSYLADPDPRLRETVESDDADFREALDRHRELAETG